MATAVVNAKFADSDVADFNGGILLDNHGSTMSRGLAHHLVLRINVGQIFAARCRVQTGQFLCFEFWLVIPLLSLRGNHELFCSVTQEPKPLLLPKLTLPALHEVCWRELVGSCVSSVSHASTINITWDLAGT